MNTKSIRFRLTMWCTLVFSVAMALVFIAFYLLTQRSLLSHTDSAITAHNEKIVEIITQEDAVMNQSFINSSQTFAQQFSEMPGMLLIIGDPYGDILYSSHDLGINESDIIDLLEKSANIIRPTFVNRNIGTTPLRFGIFPAERSDQRQAIVLMGQPMDVIQKSLNTLTLTLVSVYVGLLAIIVAGGFLLARKALSPISQVSKQLKKISAENLKERVPNPNTGDEIEELSQTFNSLLDHLNDAFIRERQFIGDVAHELKTPVATLKGGVEVTMSKKRTNREYKRALDETLIDINQLSAIIKNILDLAWTGAENTKLVDGYFDLSNALIELQEIVIKLASRKRIVLESEIDPGIVVGGAEDKISRAVLNIVDNAIKYTPGGGSVTISLRKEKGNARLEVKDTGIGIPKKELGHIFERFYRGSKATKTLGSGLGLAISQGIIKAHRGEIKIKSKVESGTSVTIILPLFQKSTMSS
ncbi:MAG: histidine kinase [Candidatus Woesebacteria bacterium GW2011_GWB1_43_14]|uniref:histidine kinase n=1 Tax=Candidatus Woesebacteria bacterium GW2011_GWB1_43_14 TaxID=1618578 RepID=A0A0G1DGE5_9BACT|nr:MAG: histidine kinase [Candidatus Woesebacteria bacterium GW2011_GWC1_42_9]KKS96975.1 MAG: histidine kinase [Candidatus Woesebacteria bacterium GW2011_GWB1_43_14]